MSTRHLVFPLACIHILIRHLGLPSPGTSLRHSAGDEAYETSRVHSILNVNERIVTRRHNLTLIELWSKHQTNQLASRLRRSQFTPFACCKSLPHPPRVEHNQNGV